MFLASRLGEIFSDRRHLIWKCEHGKEVRGYLGNGTQYSTYESGKETKVSLPGTLRWAGVLSRVVRGPGSDERGQELVPWNVEGARKAKNAKRMVRPRAASSVCLFL